MITSVSTSLWAPAPYPPLSMSPKNKHPKKKLFLLVWSNAQQGREYCTDLKLIEMKIYFAPGQDLSLVSKIRHLWDKLCSEDDPNWWGTNFTWKSHMAHYNRWGWAVYRLANRKIFQRFEHLLLAAPDSIREKQTDPSQSGIHSGCIHHKEKACCNHLHIGLFAVHNSRVSFFPAEGELCA